MGALRRAMVYLGLAEEDERNDTYDDFDEPSAHHETSARDEQSAALTNLQHQTPAAGVVRDVEVGAWKRRSTPRTYNEAKNIGENFRDGMPVIMNLTDLDDADAKRLVDFGAGLVFGLHGSIERVTNKVFLLSPVHLEATASEVEAPRLAPAASSSRAERMSTINPLRPPEPTARPAQPPLSKPIPRAGGWSPGPDSDGSFGPGNGMPRHQLLDAVLPDDPRSHGLGDAGCGHHALAHLLPQQRLRLPRGVQHRRRP